MQAGGLATPQTGVSCLELAVCEWKRNSDLGGAANVLPPEARVKSIRILISNHGLNHRGGSELYVRDIAIRLKRRGRHPVAYSPSLGAVAEDLRRAGVPTIDNLRLLTEEPDVIHGHHHFDAAAAALRFPRSPGIHVCHGWVPPESLLSFSRPSAAMWRSATLRASIS